MISQVGLYQSVYQHRHLADTFIVTEFLDRNISISYDVSECFIKETNVMTVSIKRRRAKILPQQCVACGTCLDVCPRGALSIFHGSFAQVDITRCVGCGLCARECPAGIIKLEVIE